MSEVPVLGLLLLAAVLTAPWWIKRVRPGAVETPVRVVGRTAISRNAVVAVVHVGDRRLLIGAAEQGVHVLTELEGNETATSPTFDPVLEDRTDAALATTEPDVEALLPDVPALVRPRIGPLDRLRAMTVRSTPPGRPIRVPLRR